MKMLALEFSSAQRSVAVAVAGPVPESRPAVPGFSSEMGGRSTRAFGLIETALEQAKIQREEIECLVVGRGPGSYTGIRAAIAIVQGWQLGRPINVLGLSSAVAIAAEAQRRGISGHVHVIIDAQRSEFYLAGYEIDANGSRETAPLRIVSKDAIEALGRAGEILVGPELWPDIPGVRQIFPRADALARLAMGGKDFINAEKLEPIYLRETAFVKAAPARDWSRNL
jgi:tRNA threonylcarbamoyl adenosine modification protein YeaZ